MNNRSIVIDILDADANRHTGCHCVEPDVCGRDDEVPTGSLFAVQASNHCDDTAGTVDIERDADTLKVNFHSGLIINGKR